MTKITQGTLYLGSVTVEVRIEALRIRAKASIPIQDWEFAEVNQLIVDLEDAKVKIVSVKLTARKVSDDHANQPV